MLLELVDAHFELVRDTLRRGHLVEGLRHAVHCAPHLLHLVVDLVGVQVRERPAEPLLVLQ